MPVRKVTTGANALESYWQTKGGEYRLYLGEVLDVLARLPARSVQCIVTSPPYWGLRDYQTGTWEGGDPACDHKLRTEGSGFASSTLGGRPRPGIGHREETWKGGICRRCGARRTDQQLGSEDRPDCGMAGSGKCGDCFVCHMVAVFREVRRVLRADGTLWLNLGDSYASGETGRVDGGHSADGRTNPGVRLLASSQPARKDRRLSQHTGLPSGNLVGVPWRVALALQADGWVLRQDIVWAKRSPMPESCTSRCTKAHEYVFLFSQGEGYYYDAEAVKEGALCAGKKGHGAYKAKKDPTGLACPDFLEGEKHYYPPSSNKRDVWTVDDHRGLLDWLAQNHPAALEEYLDAAAGKTDVWWVGSGGGYRGAHFATFAMKLVEPCVLAGTSAYGACKECGAPWKRVVRGTGVRGDANEVVVTDKSFGDPGGRGDGRVRRPTEATYRHTKEATDSWRPTCACKAGVRPCVVFDPFVGSGTTLAVAVRLGRWGWGIDLSQEYLDNHAVPRVAGELLGVPALRGLVAGEPTPAVVVGKPLPGR